MKLKPRKYDRSKRRKSVWKKKDFVSRLRRLCAKNKKRRKRSD